MDQTERVKQQFNRQAEQFASWEVTGNEVNLERFSRFCELRAEDRVLDVACGSGNMAIHCAPGVAAVDGVDISERMITLARVEAQRNNLKNVKFCVAGVERLPYADGQHNLVMSRAAFHHFADPGRVLDEMLRCCRPGGRLCIQDIIAYGDPEIDAYVEKLERAIDASHFRTLPRAEFTEAFVRAGLAAVRGVEFHIRLDLNNYVGHAVQSDSMRKEVDRLIHAGLNDPKLSRVFDERDGRLHLLRNVLFLGGRKIAADHPEAQARPPRIVRLDLTRPTWNFLETGRGGGNSAQAPEGPPDA